MIFSDLKTRVIYEKFANLLGIQKTVCELCSKLTTLKTHGEDVIFDPSSVGPMKTNYNWYQKMIYYNI